MKQRVILVYNTMWEEPLDIPTSVLPADCILTTDRQYLQTANMVVFHLPDLHNKLEEDLEKPKGQKWVAWSLECEENYPFLKDTEFMSLFDYRMSYHQNADVVYPYYAYTYPKMLLQAPIVPFQDKKDICMLISSPFNKSGRQEYLQELMQHISIDSYGELFQNCTLEQDRGRESKMELYQQYKFVIAFENSCATDYVTEKFFDPLLVGAVPIYLGAPNIEAFAPGIDCFVNTRRFDSPVTLATFLTVACQDETLYNQLQAWRKFPLNTVFLTKTEAQRELPFLRLCKLV